MFRFLKRKRYTVTIMGLESGARFGPISFVQFRQRARAQMWCDDMNRRDGNSDLTKWEVFEL